MKLHNNDTSEKVDELFAWADEVTKGFKKPVKSLWEQLKDPRHFKPASVEEVKKWLEGEWNKRPVPKKKKSS